MRIIVSVILLAFITVSCGTNKRVYAPPFEEEETETVVVKENVQTTAQNPTKKTENTKPVVSREENIKLGGKAYGKTEKTISIGQIPPSHAESG